MKNHKKQNIIQLLLALIVILLINYISSQTFFRLDLTSDKRYTLSEVTHELLDSLDDIVYIEIYLEGDMPIGFQRMQKSIKEMLDEFQIIAGGNIHYSFINPSKSTNQSKRNALYQDLYERGLEPSNVKERDEEGGMAQKVLFPGAIITYGGKETPVNFLKNNPAFSTEVNLNNSIQDLEYAFVDAIRKITSQKHKKIAFIEGQSELDEYETGDITRELAEYYSIDRLTIKEYLGILDPYDAVIIAGPKEKYTEKSKFILDQYIMNGGKVLWFLDAVSVNMDSLSTGSSTFALINDVNLNDQLFKYGVRINPNVIQDVQCALIPVNTAAGGAQPKFVPAPWLYYPLLIPPDNHPVTKSLNLIKTEFPGVIDTVGVGDDITKKILLSSSAHARVLDAPLLVNLAQVQEQINPGAFHQSNLPIAVLLEGSFESVFKNRYLENIVGESDVSIKETSKRTEMIVVADADIIRNEVRERADGVFISPLGYDRYTKQTYGNKEFVMNAVHYLVDQKGLLELRSREFKLRMLDKAKIIDERLRWQLMNTIIPVIFIFIFGGILIYIRKRKYTV
ncbi:MAG TPA: gliding motility-associated ABC transporter substrate-binding protein GldG [Bacteroidales bacterium]|nr:gliding motility-associated ABC transporter substrate-binding protein GldG [Bacteroidales bacterium]